MYRGDGNDHRSKEDQNTYGKKPRTNVRKMAKEWKMTEGGVRCIAKDVYGRKGGTDYEKEDLDGTEQGGRVKITEYTQNGNCHFLAYIPSWRKN